MKRVQKRDMAYLEGLMLKIETGVTSFQTMTEDIAEALGMPTDGLLPKEDAEKLDLHLNLLADADFAKLEQTHDGWIIRRITMAGHDFLDRIHDKT